MSLEDIRIGGEWRVAEILKNVEGGRAVVVNCADYSDLEVFVLGLLEAEESGKSFIYRTGPSFARARGGISKKEPLRSEELYRARSRSGNGLILVGSHVAMTTRQLEKALKLDGLRAIELCVPNLLKSEGTEAELQRVSAKVNRWLVESDVLVYTSRELVSKSAGLSGFEIGEVVSSSLVEIMRRVDRDLPLGFVISKGGITSSDVGTKGLNVLRARVAGQLFPGIVPVWILPHDSDYPGLPYVVFPGNVGDEDSLKEGIEILRAD